MSCFVRFSSSCLYFLTKIKKSTFLVFVLNKGNCGRLFHAFLLFVKFYAACTLELLNKTADYIPFVYVCRTHSTTALHVHQANVIGGLI